MLQLRDRPPESHLNWRICELYRRILTFGTPYVSTEQHPIECHSFQPFLSCVGVFMCMIQVNFNEDSFNSY